MYVETFDNIYLVYQGVVLPDIKLLDGVTEPPGNIICRDRVC